MKTTRYFVTATDTGVGKTEVSCALLRLLAKSGEKPFSFKPFESGGTKTDSDSAKLCAAAGAHQALDSICLYRFWAPLAPGIAAKLEGRRTSWQRVLSHFSSFEGPGVVEGAGGLFVPLDSRHDVVDLAEALALPIVVVARAGLGTVNHTTLTLQTLLARKLRVAGVVLCQSTPQTDASVPHNRRELERRFSSIRFAGPVPFIAHRARRATALERAVKSLELVPEPK